MNNLCQEKARKLIREMAANLECGCYGGNLSGNLWYFGLEPGDGRQLDGKSKYNFHLEPEKNSEGDVGKLEIENKIYCVRDNPYGRYFNQFFRELFNLKTMGGKKAVEDSFWNHNLLAGNGPAYRGNIFPIFRKNHSLWNNLFVLYDDTTLGKAPDVTGWKLEEYYEETLKTRRPVLISQLQNNKDNGITTLVVATGTGSKEHFAKAFGVDVNKFEQIKVNEHRADDAFIAPITNSSSEIISWLYVIPFYSLPGVGRLSYADQRSYARILKDILCKKGFDTSTLTA